MTDSPSSQTSGQRVILATWRTDMADGNDRLLLLAAWLRRQGLHVELVAMGDGPAASHFHATAPTLVVDDLRRTRIAAIPHALGFSRVTQGIKSLRLRRWLRSRRDAAFYIHHPAAAGLVRYLRIAPARLVASLPDPLWTIDRIAPADLHALSAAAAWVVADRHQVADVADRFGVPVEELGAVIDPGALPSVTDARPGRGVVVVVSAADAWNTPEPTIELLWRLRRTRPAIALRWLVADDRNMWLAHHDLDHADLTGVEVSTLDDPQALARAGMVVRTADEPVGEALMVAAILAGLPVIDQHGRYGRPGDGGDSVYLESTEVAINRLRDDEVEAGRQGRIAAATLAHLNLEDRAGAVLRLLQP